MAHSSGLSDLEIWDVGKHTLRHEPGRSNIHGRADAPVQSFLDFKLRALRDDNPFARHTSIKDWPLGADDNDKKERWKLICLELSEDSRIDLKLPAEPISLL